MRWRSVDSVRLARTDQFRALLTRKYISNIHKIEEHFDLLSGYCFLIWTLLQGARLLGAICSQTEEKHSTNFKLSA